MPNAKVRPKNLTVGQEILVSSNGNDLRVAGTKRDAFIARLTSPVDVVDSPTGGRRGYKIWTDKGEIPFVTGVTAIMTPTEADRRRDADRARAATEASAVLNGLAMDEEQRQAIAPARPEPKPTPNGGMTLAARASAAPVPPVPTGVRALSRSDIPIPTGPEAAANYRALARAAATDTAQAFWEGKARQATGGGA
jgi:hypothetical protein